MLVVLQPAVDFVGRAGNGFVDLRGAMGRLPDIEGVLDALTPHLLTGATIVVTRSGKDRTDVIPVNLLVVRRLDYGEARILVLEAQ